MPSHHCPGGQGRLCVKLWVCRGGEEEQGVQAAREAAPVALDTVVGECCAHRIQSWGLAEPVEGLALPGGHSLQVAAPLSSE